MKKEDKDELKDLCEKIKVAEDYTYDNFDKLKKTIEQEFDEGGAEENFELSKIQKKLKQWNISGPETDVKTFLKETIEAVLSIF
ncbi:MAG: hypothetical protein CVU98_11315 [Firmicutes bacterium HGW-Firmicutes-3]|jgi:hypothetical protein|nr:MAG: hypothetical protein CVU98_11315 [Firmicutes bacterium HGW-Firmicutes-3]